jgi:hypothetical protein
MAAIAGLATEIELTSSAGLPPSGLIEQLERIVSSTRVELVRRGLVQVA